MFFYLLLIYLIVIFIELKRKAGRIGGRYALPLNAKLMLTLTKSQFLYNEMCKVLFVF